jgi:hypothetical protein
LIRSQRILTIVLTVCVGFWNVPLGTAQDTGAEGAAEAGAGGAAEAGAEGAAEGIGGTLRDLDGTVHPDQPITVTDAEGNVLAQTTSAADGSFQLPPLADGSYSLQAGNAPPYALDVVAGMTSLDIVVSAAALAAEEEDENRRKPGGYLPPGGEAAGAAASEGISWTTIALVSGGVVVVGVLVAGGVVLEMGPGGAHGTGAEGNRDGRAKIVDLDMATDMPGQPGQIRTSESPMPIVQQPVTQPPPPTSPSGP